MSAETLAHALAELGVVCRVEARDRLALLVAADADGVADRVLEPEVRERILDVVAEHGFTHVAIELGEPSRASSPLPEE